MGNVSSRPDDGAALYLRDQNRLTLTSLSITNSRRRTLLYVVPNAFPSTRVTAKRDMGNDSIVEFVQDLDPTAPGGPPSFLLRLDNDDELNFNFTFVIRQSQGSQANSPANIGQAVTTGGTTDTTINGLTYIFASNQRELENLVTREFHADPNLHKNSNVQLVGDFSTEGSNAVQFEWSWKWRPPKALEDRGGGWRNSCSFVEYDQRAHRLNTLASFSFWVHNVQRTLHSPKSASPRFEMSAPPKLRVPSSQSIESRLSSSEGQADVPEPPSPDETLVENGLGLPIQASTQTAPPINVDISCQRPGDDMSIVEDGPLFRATMKSLEQKNANMRTKMKKVLKRAEAAQQAQLECNDAVSAFMEALREAASSNANAVKPALEHYFDKIAREILYYEKQNTINMQKLVIDPLNKLYTIDIKQAEAKKRDFEEESKEYYAYVGRYLGQRQDSLKEKKRAESDTKYQMKRRNFELKRFDYSSFMQDLHGGRKEQEVLSQLTKFAYAQAKTYLATSDKIKEMMPQLEALNHEVREADKEYQFQRTEREEKRRALETSNKTYVEPESTSLIPPPTSAGNNGSYISDAELSRADSTSSTVRTVGANTTATLLSPEQASLGPPPSKNQLLSSPGTQPTSTTSMPSPGQNKFKGIRDLEEKDYGSLTTADKSGGEQRKEGLLWALSRPGSHLDPKGLNKQAWHKFWVVLDQGKLSEYSNWKQKLDLHMEPIDLRMASVREARNAERRFCLEVITPQYKRVYQATSEEDMKNWITSINNALQSAMEGRGRAPGFNPPSSGDSSIRRDIGSVLTGKNPSHNYGAGSNSYNAAAAAANSVFRRTTVGARPAYIRQSSTTFEDDPERLLQIVREADQGNCWCADCGSGIKAEWVSINLGIVLCIECSGIHRSLGTHISKVRSLTLDTTSFTTDIVELILQIGNRVSNMIWEAKLDSSMKPAANSTREQRLKFITAKYVDRAHVQPISSTLSHYSTPDDTLLASIKKNDLQGVLYALALRANPNATDKSRNTHAVFLALAAADPASPQSPMTTPPRPATPGTPGKVVAFPVAELLVQNGAEIPTTMPAFPLSAAAKLYIEQKAARSNGGDTVGALPNINANREMSPAERQKEREARLQKRVSAGGRLARAPAPFDR